MPDDGELAFGAAATPAPSGPAKYDHKLDVYAVRFGVHLRTIKSWIAKGKPAAEGEPHDKPPLDHPADMPTWWARHMDHRVPEKILSLAAQAAAPVVSATAGSPSSEQKSASSSEGDMGSSLERIRGAEREAYAAYQDARRRMGEFDDVKNADGAIVDKRCRGSHAEVEATRRHWSEAMDMLRKSEGAALKFADIKGDHLPRREVARELREMHSSLADTLRGFVDRVFPKIAGKPIDDARVVWSTELDRLFLTLPDDIKV